MPVIENLMMILVCDTNELIPRKQNCSRPEINFSRLEDYE